MQRACLCYYTIITYYYVIITPGSIITHYYLFQSPELADVCSWLSLLQRTMHVFSIKKLQDHPATALISTAPLLASARVHFSLTWRTKAHFSGLWNSFLSKISFSGKISHPNAPILALSEYSLLMQSQWHSKGGKQKIHDFHLAGLLLELLNAFPAWNDLCGLSNGDWICAALACCNRAAGAYFQGFAPQISWKLWLIWPSLLSAERKQNKASFHSIRAKAALAMQKTWSGAHQAFKAPASVPSSAAAGK